MVRNHTSDYWISPNAFSIELNAMGMHDYIQPVCSSGAQIMCYIKNIISYDEGHNYRRWTLVSSPTAFRTHTAKYVYVAIPRDMSKTTAQVVFPSDHIDVYGKVERTVDGTTTEEQIGSTDYYYIFLQGIIKSSGDDGLTARDWAVRLDYGTLATNEALSATESPWFSYSNVDEIVTFLKDLTMKAGTKFHSLFADTLAIVTNGRIQFGQAANAPYVTGIAGSETAVTSEHDVVTPKYMDDNALSKSHNDKTDYDLEMQNLKANGTADIFGNVTIQNNGKFSIGTYNKGIQGAQIDWYGNAEFESIVARSFLEVPELRYNRTTITVGNKWQTVGAGIIERVWAGTGDNALTGIAKLKLEATEPGAIAVDDKCQGIFHFVEGNDTQTSDPKNGNYHFAGFTTVYFIVKEIYTADTLPDDIKATLPEDETIGDNQFFRYELRAKTCADLAEGNRNRWTDAHHPQPSMHFACYANATNSARQACRLTTTTYQLHLAGMTDWTYTQDNIRLIIGWLDGFTLTKQVWDSAQQKLVQQDKPLEGEGIAVGNMYMWGTIDQFDRAPYLMSQQLYYRGLDDDITPREITLSADRKTYSLNGWGTTPVTPSPTTRYVWQQWLYAYSDGTYGTSNVSLSAIDNTLLTVIPNRSLVSVALSDWYDPDNPDDVTFDISAQIRRGNTALAITTATAAYESDGATLTYTTTLSADHKTVTYHITIAGYVGVSLDGATPEDTYLTLTLGTSLGSAEANVTLSQNREGEAGMDGQSMFTSYVFRRSATLLTTAPTGGTYASPHPTTEGWSDGVPSGTDPVYMSSRIFTSDGNSPQQEEWSTPCLMADTADIDICYNAYKTRPNNPAEHGTQTTGGWHDTATENDIWMAVSSKVGGEWGAWQISKIKGEKGEPGTGITLKGSAIKYFEIYGDYELAEKNTGTYLVFGRRQSSEPNPLIGSSIGGAFVYTYNADADSTTIAEANVGDSYICYDDGHMYMVEEGATSNVWIDCGQIRGAAGQSIFTSYVFRRSATRLTIPPTGGTYSDPSPDETEWEDGVPSGTDPVYMSSRIFTNDGLAPQQEEWSTPCLMADTADIDICYNAQESYPNEPNEHGTQTSFGWHDTATPNDIWMAVSSKTGGEWGAWQISKIKGEKGNPGKSAYQLWLDAGNTGSEADFLESLIGQSGKSVSTIIEYYARNNDKDNAPTSGWSTTLVNPDADHLYLWNKETILDSDGEEITTTTPALIAIYTKDGKGISSITEWYALSTSKTEVTGTWGRTVPTMDRTNRYLWNYEVISYTDSSTTQTTPAVIGVYGDTGLNGSDMGVNLCDGTLNGDGWTLIPSTGKRGSISFQEHNMTLFDYVDNTMAAGSSASYIISPEVQSLLRDEALTLSFEAKTERGELVSEYDFLRVIVYYYNGASWTALLNEVIPRASVLSGWNRFTFNMDGVPSSAVLRENNGLRIRFDNIGDPYSPYPENTPDYAHGYLRTVSVRRVKLEYGNTASSWCLSENDKRGKQGAEGLSIRRSEWEEGKYYRNDSDLTSGTRYLDEVCVTNAAQNTSTWWIATSAHNGIASDQTNKPGTASGFWTQLNDMAPIRTPYADIQTAFIQFLNVAQIILKQGNDIYGAFGNPTGTNQWPLWFGATDPAQAPFRVNAQGELFAANVNASFQDMREYINSEDYTSCAYWNDGWLDITHIRNGGEYITIDDDGKNLSTSIQKNVFNLRVDGVNVLLPTDQSWVGQRVLLFNGCRKKSAAAYQDLGQEVTNVRMMNNKYFAGARSRYTSTSLPDNMTAEQFDTLTQCLTVTFWDGVMEFIGVPDGNDCVWAIINDSAGIVWYDDNPVRNMM